MIDLMIKEYPTKHSEYSVILQERERQRIAKEYSVSTQTTNIIVVEHITKSFHGDGYLLIFIFDLFIANAATEPSEGGGQQGSRVHKEGGKKSRRVQQ